MTVIPQNCWECSDPSPVQLSGPEPAIFIRTFQQNLNVFMIPEELDLLQVPEPAGLLLVLVLVHVIMSVRTSDQRFDTDPHLCFI